MDDESQGEYGNEESPKYANEGVLGENDDDEEDDYYNELIKRGQKLHQNVAKNEKNK